MKAMVEAYWDMESARAKAQRAKAERGTVEFVAYKAAAQEFLSAQGRFLTEAARVAKENQGCAVPPNPWPNDPSAFWEWRPARRGWYRLAIQPMRSV